MSEQRNQHPFITHLESLRDNRAALADLRRALSSELGAAAAAYRHVVRAIPEAVQPGTWEWTCYTQIAALFALHPALTARGNLGDHFATTLKPNEEGNEAIERRFTNLLMAHPDDLAFHLRQAISFLRAHDVAVNWQQLLWDMRRWGYPDGQADVQQRWATSFWRRGATPKEVVETQEQ